jgi:hypothetical protein
MALYKYKDLINKTIVAKADIKLYRNALDTAIPYAVIKAGNPIGVLYSWVSAKANRNVDWLMFYDSNNKAYYVPMISGTLDEAALKQQGVKDVEEQTKEAEDKAKKNAGAVSYYIEKYVPYLLGAIILVPVLKTIINKKL